MRQVFFSTLSFLIVATGALRAQQTTMATSQANQKIDVIKVYEMVVADGYESVQIYQKLADTNYERGRYAKAKKWYKKWFNKDKKPESIAYLKYAKTLEALNEDEKAQHYLTLYEKKTK